MMKNTSSASEKENKAVLSLIYFYIITQTMDFLFCVF